MAENQKGYGRTFFDFISEYPKVTFFTVLLLVGVIVFLIIKGNSFKIGSIEVNSVEKIRRDTVMLIERETIWVEKPKVITKYSDQKVEGSATTVKRGDTIIEAKNQPANINTGVNHGVIGNENTFNVNIKEVQRVLDEPSKRKLIQLIEEIIESNNLNRDTRIQISSISNNESFNFARQIEQFLKSEGYNISSAIGAFQISPPIIGTRVGLDRSHIVIKVGYISEK